jgi:hypothetical protein
MIGQLVQVCCPSGSSPELIDPVENSSREVVELRAEVERLQRENLEFRQQVGYWKSRHRDALLRIAALEQKVEQLEGGKRQLQADLFGRRSETTPLKDRPSHGMVQKRPFSGNTRDLSADPDRSRVGAGLRESLVAVLGLQFRENRVYPMSSRSQRANNATSSANAIALASAGRA